MKGLKYLSSIGDYEYNLDPRVLKSELDFPVLYNIPIFRDTVPVPGDDRTIPVYMRFGIAEEEQLVAAISVLAINLLKDNPTFEEDMMVSGFEVLEITDINTMNVDEQMNILNFLNIFKNAIPTINENKTVH